MNKFKYNESYQYLSSACLNFTDACNLACKYCFVAQQPHYMTLNTAKQSVDFLIKNLRIKKDKKLINSASKSDITFFGGEPMIMWDSIIVPLTKYIKEKYPNEIDLSMTTNGTLLNKERIDFLYENNIPILLSIDGYKDTQDFNRPCQNNESSFDLIIKNIPYLLEKFPNTTFRSTIYAPTVQHTFENYIFASYLGFNNIFMMPNCRESWSEQDKQILKQEIEKIYDYIIESFQENKNIINFSTINESFERVLHHDIKVFNKEKENINFSRSCLRCGLGTNFGSIGYDGKIYGCQEQDSKNIKSKFFIGDIFNGINTNIHKKLLKEYSEPKQLKCINEKICENCKIKNICSTQACPSTTQDLFNSFFIDSEIHCLWQQFLFDNAIRTMSILVKENNQFFKKYLDFDCHYNEYFVEEMEK